MPISLIVLILAILLFIHSLLKWMSEQSSSAVFGMTLVGCLIAVFTSAYFPLNAIILVITFILPLIINFLNNRAIKAMNKDDYNTCYRLIKRDSINAAAYAKLGNLLEKDKKFKEAIDAYEKSLESDPTQKEIDRRYQYLVEQYALKESGQIRCPKCMTIVPLEYGKCWKCEKIFDRRQFIFSSIRKKGGIGIILISICFISMLISMYSLAATINGILKSNMMFSVSLTILVIFCILSYLIFKKK